MFRWQHTYIIKVEAVVAAADVAVVVARAAVKPPTGTVSIYYHIIPTNCL